MIDQSTPGGKPNIEGIKVAGKTGTPQRNITKINSKGKSYAEKRQDGWYVFYAPTPDKRSHTVVCIRIELGDKSLNAIALAREIAPILKEMGYLDSF
jgi:cell division protein FtsI/penicillin-binding protein 2